MCLHASGHLSFLNCWFIKPYPRAVAVKGVSKWWAMRWGVHKSAAAHSRGGALGLGCMTYFLTGSLLFGAALGGHIWDAAWHGGENLCWHPGPCRDRDCFAIPWDMTAVKQAGLSITALMLQDVRFNFLNLKSALLRQSRVDYMDRKQTVWWQSCDHLACSKQGI